MEHIKNGKFKNSQTNLVDTLLDETYAAHNALDDTRLLFRLITCTSQGNVISDNITDFIFSPNYPHNCHMQQDNLKTFSEAINCKALSKATALKAARSNLRLCHLKLSIERNGLDGLRALLSELTNQGKVRVTSCKKIIRGFMISLLEKLKEKWLSHERCGPFIICRDDTIWCINSLSNVLWHLTRRGLINFGLLSLPKEIDFMPKDVLPQDNHVLIIGAGVSGLSAAHQLNHFGVKVSKGAQIINGCDNNPLIVLSHQTGVHIKELSEKCCLLQKGGEKVDEKTDSQMDFHFNAILDIIADQRRNKEILQDLNLMDKFRETHQHFMDESQLTFTKQQETLLNFHFGNLEYACGTSLSNISSMNWDQNEDYPQFSGRNVLMADGFSTILDKITENLDIVYNTEISSIDYSDKVLVKSSDGQSWTGDKVIVTLPLAVLKNGIVQFTPPLPQNKVTAIQQLGVGYMEKVVLQFKERFWSDKSSPSEVFGRVETEFSRRGLFGVFHDLSKENASGKSCYILSTHISGDSVEILKQKSDEEIISMCIETLSELFPKKKVPKPQKYIVTRWYQDKHIQMAYSHIPVGATGDLYDDLAADVQGRIYFAGEATNRQHPQSVTGAYISGMREAEKVFTSMAIS
ncbi:AOF1 [Mytilus edulis]|uniref:KDM1B n=1 Tax=Mytilus edulis TaxID=6550 RepID=A0A8S3ULN0_MYTED|nr:AOF1 [Mytilus edulis]